MTGNVALDVFIGLAFIYLLYSLYATVVVEIITSILRLRSNNLKKAIKRMLTDEEGWQLLKRIKKSKVSIFSKFYYQPNIKYLSKTSVIGRRPPSYIAPHSFSKAIVDILKTEGTGNTLIQKVKTGIDNCPIDENTRSHIKSLLEDANNDLQKFKLLLEQWFNDTMERSIGWFKRNNQFILFIIGLFIAITFNVNTLHIAKLLSKDNKAREQLVNAAMNETEKYRTLVNNLQDTTELSDTLKKDYEQRIDSLYNIKKELKTDIENTQILFGGGWNLPSKIICKKNSNLSFEGNQRLFKEDSLFLLGNDSIGKIRKDKIIPSFSTNNYTIDTAIFGKSLRTKYESFWVKKNNKRVKKCIYKPWRYKITYACHNFWGYFLTALAISLGSPFWFDLLNKLVKLRGSARQAVTSEGSGIKQKNPKDESSDNPLNRVG